ncbi:hypothetical protein MUK42_15791 [Musa troglodytarum]|nr:hypothetical protein MUK42_15791 [Musa troglodytarum]URE42038.1 hypothetical protein MUK42_15791 [Musa troglodytarum]
MDTVEMDYMEEEQTARTFPDQFPSPDPVCRNGIYDEPQLCPRIGDGYQVEILALATESQCLSVKACVTSTSNVLAVEHHVGVGLPISIMWVQRAGDDTKVAQKEFSGTNIEKIRADDVKVDQSCSNKGESVDYRNTEKSQADAVHRILSKLPGKSSNNNCVNLCSLTCEDDCIGTQKCCKEFGESINKRRMDSGVPLQQFSEANDYSALPGSPSSSWSEDETQSFLLGLYIFGKNLGQVKRFIECKKMGDILSHYYGNFYKSDAYCRWSECRKIRSRRCILGHRIFTGWRQQEFLSRVLPRIPKDVQHTLMEATNILNEGRVSLEEFVCTLKATVGLLALVDVIGIGKGHDLTSIISDPVRSNQSLSIRSEIPVGKACSSLTSGDIIKILTGDFRLSKAKSNDLFWEAVWPRLLARGWHSEQPKDVSSKHVLVFLMPGIKKFSRKKLVKGHHYFDSVSDVLNKVASDPSLMELEDEGADSTKDENGCAMDTESIQNGLLDRQRHRYLRPKVSICNSELMKFTIVDTSLVQGDEPFKVRELRSLPIEASSNCGPLTHTGQIGSDSSGDSDDSSSDDQEDYDSDAFDNKKPKVSSKGTVGKAVHAAPSGNALTLSSTILPTNGYISSDQCLGQLNGKLHMKNTKSQFSRRAKSDRQSYLAPMPKRRLTACKEQTGHHAYSFLNSHEPMEEGAQPKLGGDDIVGDMYPKMSTDAGPDQLGKWDFKEECCGNAATLEATFSDGKPGSRNLIDLNVPPNVPLDFENGEHLNSESAGSQHDLNEEEAVNLTETKQQHDGFGAVENVTEEPGDQQPLVVNSRRQSTRNRPPTTKALEALACGFLGTKRRGRDTRGLLSGSVTKRPSRHVRKTAVEAPAPAPPTNTNSCAIGVSNATVNDLYKGSIHQVHTSSESRVQPDGDGIQNLLSVQHLARNDEDARIETAVGICLDRLFSQHALSHNVPFTNSSSRGITDLCIDYNFVAVMFILKWDMLQLGQFAACIV